jgi:hypothetical protein
MLTCQIPFFWTALTISFVDAPPDVTVTLLCPARFAVILTCSPRGGDTVTSSGSEADQAAWTFVDLPCASTAKALASTVS